MRLIHLATSFVAAALLVCGLAADANAAQINASLIPELDKAVGSFVGVKFIQIKYPPESAISKLFDGRVERIEFSIKGTNSSGMGELMAAANNALLKVDSVSRVKNANLTYSGVLRGGPDMLTLTYNAEFITEFSGYKLDRNATDNIPIDVNWRGFVIDGLLLVDSPRGRIDINRPIGLLEVTLPEFAGKILNTEAREILEEPILDFTDVSAIPMERWHWLFDPTWSQASTGGLLTGEGIGNAKVMSVYSLGECSIREGCSPPKEVDASVNIDEIPLHVHISTPQPNAQIEIAGFTRIESSGGHDIIRVSMEEATLVVPDFTIIVLLVFGGMMAVIALIVLLKAKK